MRKEVFLDELPIFIEGANKGKINWKESIGHKIGFVYSDIEGEVEIIGYNSKNQKLTIKYKDKIDDIRTDSLCKCRLGRFLGKITNEFRIEIGTTFKDDKRNLTIIDREYREVKIKDKTCKSGYTIAKRKYYKYHCNIDNNEDWMEESNLLHHKKGCNVCSGKKVTIENCIYTVAPWMMELGVSEEDAKTHTVGSRCEIEVICPCCSQPKITTPNKISQTKSIGCNCGDGISYPEKFMFKVLSQLNIDFIYQYTKTNAEWCSKYRYDFYFILNEKEYIIETHGEQHYKENINWYGKGNITIENDKIKKKLALSKNINYIEIDCSESNLEYIKNNILNSELSELFDLTNINWIKCGEYALKNIVYEVCNYYNNVTKDINCISNKFKINSKTIGSYLKLGNELNICDYNSGKKYVSVYKEDIHFGIFESIIKLEEMSEYIFSTKLSNSTIVATLKGKQESHKGFKFKYSNKKEYNNYIKTESYEELRIRYDNTEFKNKNTYYKVKVYDKYGNFYGVYNGVVELSGMSEYIFGVKLITRYIYMCVNNKKENYKNLIFKVATDKEYLDFINNIGYEYIKNNTSKLYKYN